MGKDDAPRGEVVAMRVEVGKPQVVGDFLVLVVRLRDQQVCVPGRGDEGVGPGGVAGGGDLGSGEAEAAARRWDGPLPKPAP